MKYLESLNFKLANFEGTLDFLLHLVQKEEIDIYEVPILEITRQYAGFKNESVESGAEFIASAAHLLWVKSKTLLPKHEQEVEVEEVQEDPRFEIIHHLIEYCQFKQTASDLAEREQRQSAYFTRGSELMSPKQTLGIEHLSLEDLAILFKQVIIKADAQKGQVNEEEWRVGDKIQYIRTLLKGADSIDFEDLFHTGMCRGELIVTFLAILELMKLGNAKVVRDAISKKVMVMSA